MVNGIVITAFYQFFDFSSYKQEKQALLDFCNSQNLKGTILISHEGVNSTISGTRESINALYEYLRTNIGIKDLEYKESFATAQPFDKMKVKLKKEIVTLGVGELDVHNRCGTYIASEEWDELINHPDVITIDTRNDYEIEIGTFAKSINPNTRTFREFPKWVDENLADKKDKKIAMFCTGGIRCEKSTAYLKQLGFKEVFHLKGGVLQYLEDTTNKNGQWLGNCFVFDERIAVDSHLEPINNSFCTQCGNRITACDVKIVKDQEMSCCGKCKTVEA